jgi:hypothetical protein
MNYSELSIKELKAIAQAKGIEVAGDKRSKATWVLALESALTQTSESIAEAIESSPTPEKVLNSKSVTSVTVPLRQADNQRRGASTVVLVIVALLYALVIVGKGLRAFIPLIAALGQLSVVIWGSIPRTIDTRSIGIDYSPA